MINANSPTVQAMFRNTPQGFGNMPMYFGAPPTMETNNQPVQQQSAPTTDFQTPYPSPKEMLTGFGQSNVYQPTSFAPRNIVGGYNPGYQAAFAGYSNPYMGYGYSGFGCGFGQVLGQNQFLTEEDRITAEVAAMNGYSYEEQIVAESELYTTISKIVSKNIGRDEEETKRCAETFKVYDKLKKEQELFKREKFELHVQVKVGDEVIIDYDPNKNFSVVPPDQYTRNVQYVDQMEVRAEQTRNAKIAIMNQMYDNAIERQFDNMDLYDFFNNGAGIIMSDMLEKTRMEQARTMTGKLYNGQLFRAMVENSGYKRKKQIKAVDRFVGRYGVMPDGRPVSPGHDPAVAESFSYNATTGKYEVTAPNFMRDRLEAARQNFIRSIDNAT